MYLNSDQFRKNFIAKDASLMNRFTLQRSRRLSLRKFSTQQFCRAFWARFIIKHLDFVRAVKYFHDNRTLDIVTAETPFWL